MQLLAEASGDAKAGGRSVCMEGRCWPGRFPAEARAAMFEWAKVVKEWLIH